MRATALYHHLRSNGDVVAASSLLGCLISRHWTLALLFVFLAALIATSSLRSIWHGFQAYGTRSFFQSFRGKYYNLRLIYLVVFLGLLTFHSDGMSGMETPLKVMLIAYLLALNTDRFRWPVLVFGCAGGAILALVFGLFELGISSAERTAGATNAIRFGMIALALGAVSAIGMLCARGSRGLAILSGAGFLCGLGAAFASGSRGALLALPVLLLLVPVLWRRSRRTLVTAAAFVAVFAGVLLATNVGHMAERIGAAYTNISTMLTTGETDKGSVGDRTKLLALSFELFSEHPLLGVGSRGWNEAAYQRAIAPDEQVRIGFAYNQAHNQYADDLAKGGIVRFALGFLVLFLPLYYFVQCEPFADRKGSEFALAGVVVSSAFMVFCLSESLMILSLPATVHAILIFYLLAACDEERRRASIANPGPQAIANQRFSSLRAGARPPAGRPRPAG